MAAHPLLRAVRGTLRGAPSLLLLGVALVTFFYLAVNDGGFSIREWGGAALLILALLVLGLVTLPAGGRPSRAALLAAGLLAAFALWSYLSISWAGEHADAWDGANRTILYALVFALFALWPLGSRAGVALVGLIGLAIGVLAVVALVKVSTADDIRPYLVGGRLAWPINYPNGSVALWFLGFWPCVTLSVRRELHPALRGLYLGFAVVLASMGLLGSSRGWLFTLPLVVIVFLAISPQRQRVAWALIAVGLALTVIGGTVLDIADAVGEGRPVRGPVEDAVRSILMAGLLAGFASAAAALVDRRIRPSEKLARRSGRGLALVAGLVLVIGVVAFVARVGDPVSWAGDRWDEFKGGAQPTASGNRLTQTLGSNRYDFWRVSADEFKDNPLAGVGADNFRHDYLAVRKSDEEPYYPHSLIARTLAGLGLVGAFLLAAAFTAAFVAAGRAIRRRTGLGAAAAAGATTSFVYFIAHGSVDWFWEMPALGTIAFALLGIAVAMEPRAAVSPYGRRARGPLVSGVAPLAGTVVAGGLVAASLAGPWLSARTTADAIEAFNANPSDPGPAIDKLDRAAALNPASAYPRLVTGQIMVVLGRVEPAIDAYDEVLERDPRDGYSHLALAALASQQGRDADAVRLAREAVALSPRDTLAQDALKVLRDGGQLDIQDINRGFDERSDERLR